MLVNFKFILNLHIWLVVKMIWFKKLLMTLPNLAGNYNFGVFDSLGVALYQTKIQHNTKEQSLASQNITIELRLILTWCPSLVKIILYFLLPCHLFLLFFMKRTKILTTDPTFQKMQIG